MWEREGQRAEAGRETVRERAALHLYNSPRAVHFSLVHQLGLIRHLLGFVNKTLYKDRERIHRE